MIAPLRVLMVAVMLAPVLQAAGGVRYPVSPGDMIHIPKETPQSYLVPEGGHITYVLVRVPAFVGEAQ